LVYFCLVFVIATIDSVLNATYEVLKLRSLWQRVLMYWALLTLGPVAIGISLAASSYLTGMAMAGHLSVYAKWLIPIGQLIFQSIILSALFINTFLTVEYCGETPSSEAL